MTKRAAEELWKCIIAFSFAHARYTQAYINVPATDDYLQKLCEVPYKAAEARLIEAFVNQTGWLPVQIEDNEWDFEARGPAISGAPGIDD